MEFTECLHITESCQVQITEAVVDLEVECSGNPTSAPGSPDGSITLTITGVTTQLLAFADDGASVAVINSDGTHTLGNLTGGTYEVEITENGVVVATCTAVVEDGEIDACDVPLGLAGEDQTICIGETATIGCEPIEGYCYYWSPTVGFSDPTQVMSSMIEVSPSETTTYTLMITDDDGNIVSPTTTDDDGNIVSLISVEVSLNGFTVEYSEVFEKCKEEAITIQPTLSDGSGNFSYLWNTGETTSSIDVSPTESTLYSVEVQDVDSDLGCSFIVSLLVVVVPETEISIASTYSSICQLSEPPALVGNLNNADNVSTDCEDNYAVILSVESNADLTGYSYLWSNDETGASIEVFEAGVYSVTITKNDANGKCIGNGYASFELNSCLEVEIEEEIIFDGTNEELILYANEGYDSYLWEGPNDFEANTSSISFTEPGTYSVTVTNEFGCSTVDEITIDCEYDGESIIDFLCGSDNDFKSQKFYVCNGATMTDEAGYPLPPSNSSMITFENGEVEYSVNISTIQNGSIDLSNYQVHHNVGNFDITYSLRFLDSNNPNVILLEFESKNLGNIFALIDVLSCYNPIPKKAYFINAISTLLTENENDCNELDVILSGLHDDYVKNYISDSKKIQYIETLISPPLVCSTCNGGLDEKQIIVKLLRNFNDNEDLFNYLTINPDITTLIHEKLICGLGASEPAKEFGNIVGALCSEYWPNNVENSTTEFIKTGKTGPSFLFFDAFALKISGDINTDQGIYHLEQNLSGPAVPDFIPYYTVLENINAGANEFEIPPLFPIRVLHMESDESIYLPAVAVYNIAAEDSYQSIKDDVLNTLTVLGLGGSIRVLTLANSARMMRVVAVVDVIKVGILDNIFNDPEFRDYILDEIDGPDHPQDGLAKDFLENVWPILSTATDIAALAVSAPTIFAKIDNTGDDIADVLHDITSPTNNSFSPTKKQLAADGRDALRQVTKVAKLIDALKAAYPALANYSRLSELAALSNADKLLGSGISNAIKALSTNQKQLDLFDDFIDNVASNVYNGNLIDDFVAKPAFTQAWDKLSGFSTAIRLGKTNLNQRRILDEWKGKIATASDKRKGNFGEMEADLDLNTKGYTSLTERIEDIDALNHRGIDGVFERNGEYFIVEGKYNTYSMRKANPNSNPPLPRQMSDNWIQGRLADAVGSDGVPNPVLANQIIAATYTRAVFRSTTGKYKLIQSNGYLGGGIWDPS